LPELVTPSLQVKRHRFLQILLGDSQRATLGGDGEIQAPGDKPIAISDKHRVD
jgi:hypothetical protein